MAIEPSRESRHLSLPQEPSRFVEGARNTNDVLSLVVTHSGACARCKNLKVRSPPLPLTGGVLIELHDDLMTRVGEMRVQG